MSDKYEAISCAFYDELEAAAVKRTLCTIVYEENGEEKSVAGLVVDFKTANKEEFMILDDKTIIRLDKIKDFNGIKPEDKMYC